MAGSRISILAELTAPAAAADFLTIVDVSDTSMAATGTNKKIKPEHLLKSIATVSIPLGAFETDNLATGDGQAVIGIGTDMNGMNLTSALLLAGTAGTGSGSNDVQIRRKRSGSSVDMCSTKPSLAAAATSSTSAVINTSNDDVATNDLIYVDGDAVTATTPAKGVVLVLGFKLP